VLANELGSASFIDSCLDDDVMGLDSAFDVVVHGYHPRARARDIWLSICWCLLVSTVAIIASCFCILFLFLYPFLLIFFISFVFK
jgi:hypothetical protein